MEKLTSVFPTSQVMNEMKDNFYPSIPDIEEEEYGAIMGRYASSTIRYMNRYQFMLAFFTVMRESLQRLRSKLKINDALREMEMVDALSGDEIVSNEAVNPDTVPSTDDYSPLEYVNRQVANKTNLSKVRGLYNWKHSVGGQAYNEFLDSFRPLFKVLLSGEEMVVYEQ